MPCTHHATHFLPNDEDIEVCNNCGMSRRHWEQGESDWLNVDLEDYLMGGGETADQTPSPSTPEDLTINPDDLIV